ncbi:hypothetical protein H2200_004079 [Cladophialophora chaetospira]|uniref:Enoyl reductase (ER) domain-containing protein n=1 Tax=Cladophialophora chaetospira TaxID=386627 RepID=A0AA38XFJ1_9EURO|nr:hypothetical protein H2200_004079 [Cladophialophora chaetospira]
MSSRRQNFGLIRQGTGRAVLKQINIPKLPDDYILVRTMTIALNPTDWTTLDAVGDDGTLMGCDYAGIVEEVGKAVKKRFKKGDRVAGFGHGGDLQVHIPDGVSFEAAATVGVAIGTVGFGLYNVLRLPLPGEQNPGEQEPILIYGGSTASATIAIQFARLSGLKVITTCSPKHFGLMKELGADLVYDYRHPDVGARIRDATEGKLKLVFDTVALESTAKICADAFGNDGGVYCNLLGIDCPRHDVRSEFFLGYSQSGEQFIFEGEHFEAKPEDFMFASRFAEVAERLWHEGNFKPHPQRVEPGGFSGVADGLQQMRESKVSGEKLVYRVEETEWP